MDTKERLARYPALHSEVLALCKRLDSLEQSELIADHAELDSIERQITANLQEMEETRSLIQTLTDPREREVLTRRYIDGTGGAAAKWKNVAIQMLGGKAEKHLRMVHRLHRSALAKIERA